MQELSAYIADTFIDRAVSADLIKSLKAKKKSLSFGDIKGYFGVLGDDNDKAINAVLITTKNGTVKKVELPYVEYKCKGIYNQFYTIKIKTKKLKKDTDYTVSGEYVVFKDSSSFTSAAPIKAT